MPSNKPRFTYRPEEITLAKINYIAEKEKRTLNKQIDKLVCDYIEKYENEHGEINV